MARLMLVDDEVDITQSLTACLESEGHSVVSARSAEQALTMLGDSAPDILVTDLKMPGMGGLALLDRIRESYPSVSVVMVTAFGTIDSAIEAMKKGACDFLSKPFSLGQLEVTVNRIIEMRRLRTENLRLTEKLEALTCASQICSRNPQMKKAIESAEEAAQSDGSVLISGSAGTGKAMVARHIHAKSKRAQFPFVSINCATLSEVLLEAELFGYTKGAFPGALTDQPGRISLADGGTIMLESIAEMGPRVQAKLIRYLKTGTYERLGDSETRRSNVRVVALSSAPLGQVVESGSLSPELLGLLEKVRVTVPSLNDRPEDILPIARQCLGRALMTQGKEPRNFSKEAEDALLSYSWPGNVRELFNVIEKAAMVAATSEITTRDFPERIRAGDGAFSQLQSASSAAGSSSLKEASLEDVERRHIEHVLATAETLEEAATILGINPSTLWRKRRRYGIE